MKNILTKTDRAEVLDRLDRLAPEAERQWGTLTAREMVCHLKDVLGVALGEREAPVRGNRILRSTVVSKLLLYPVPWGRGMVETPKEMDPKRAGSQPGDFAEDKAELRRFVDRFVEMSEADLAPHPVFGRISKRDWGRATWRNFDHHLRQFGL